MPFPRGHAEVQTGKFTLKATPSVVEMGSNLGPSSSRGSALEPVTAEVRRGDGCKPAPDLKNQSRVENRVLDEIASCNKLLLFQMFLWSFCTHMHTHTCGNVYTCYRWQSVFYSYSVYWVNNVLCSLWFFLHETTYASGWLKLRCNISV